MRRDQHLLISPLFFSSTDFLASFLYSVRRFIPGLLTVAEILSFFLGDAVRVKNDLSPGTLPHFDILKVIADTMEPNR
jgi:hypothetical protein